jgi:pimeloyl-ACP methyl ester carboxylesterase
VEHPISYRITKIAGLSIFDREAGPKDAPTLLLLHGLPSSSRMFEPFLHGSPASITRLPPALFFIVF